MSFEIVKPTPPEDKSTVLRVGFQPSNTDRFVPYLLALVRGHTETGTARVQIPIGIIPGIRKATTMVTKLREAVLAITHGAVFYPELDADILKKVWPFYEVNYSALDDAVVIKSKREVKPMTSTVIADWTLKTTDLTFEEDLTSLATLRTNQRFFGKVTIIGMFDKLEFFMNKFPMCLFERTRNNEHVML
jgi:hypothetical protein